jgi:hypothetical protein
MNPIIQFFQNLLKPKQLATPMPTGGLQAQNLGPVYPDVRSFKGGAPISGQNLHGLLSQNRGKDLPILQNLTSLINAGNQLPSNMDPLLPIILAIRETQGGRYNKGQNNPYNIRGEQYGTTKFIDYPNLKTATFGGYNPHSNVESQGLLGLLTKNDIYSNFRNTGNLSDLFARYSPTSDNNGSLDQQVENYNWIRNQILGLNQEGG